MCVDMFECSFIRRVRSMPRFVPCDERDEEVWAMGFPSWRAIFSALCLYGHSTGYRLPTYSRFFNQVRYAFCHVHPDRDRFRRYFREPLLDGMRQRVSVWYESGMCETFLYVCLVEAIEDKSKVGIVLYDSRIDWKMKTDLIVLVGGKAIRINAFWGEEGSRPGAERRRDEVEVARKWNTMESSHWRNRGLEDMRELRISRTDQDCQEVNGLRLFSVESVNSLLERIYCHAGVCGGYFFRLSKAGYK